MYRHIKFALKKSSNMVFLYPLINKQKTTHRATPATNSLSWLSNLQYFLKPKFLCSLPEFFYQQSSIQILILQMWMEFKVFYGCPLKCKQTLLFLGFNEEKYCNTNISLGRKTSSVWRVHGAFWVILKGTRCVELWTQSLCIPLS